MQELRSHQNYRKALENGLRLNSGWKLKKREQMRNMEVLILWEVAPAGSSNGIGDIIHPGKFPLGCLRVKMSTSEKFVQIQSNF